ELKRDGLIGLDGSSKSINYIHKITKRWNMTLPPHPLFPMFNYLNNNKKFLLQKVVELLMEGEMLVAMGDQTIPFYQKLRLVKFSNVAHALFLFYLHFMCVFVSYFPVSLYILMILVNQYLVL